MRGLPTWRMIVVGLVMQIGLLFGHEGGEVVHGADPGSVGEMGRKIRDAAATGAVRVRFPGGEWNWACSCQVELPAKEKFAKLALKPGKGAHQKVVKWLARHEVRGVQVRLSAGLKPSAFFDLEKILRKEGVVYWLSVDEDAKGEVVELMETDGRARVVPPDGERSE